jgi:hypothetical protein
MTGTTLGNDGLPQRGPPLRPCLLDGAQDALEPPKQPLNNAHRAGRFWRCRFPFRNHLRSEAILARFQRPRQLPERRISPTTLAGFLTTRLA